MIQSTAASSGRPTSAAIATPLARSASQSRHVMRLKPKRCSRRKVAYQSNGSSSAAPMVANAATQRDLVRERTEARRDRVAQRDVERVEAAEQRPAEQDRRAGDHLPVREARLGERVVGGALVRRRASTRARNGSGTSSRWRATWRTWRASSHARVASDTTSAVANAIVQAREDIDGECRSGSAGTSAARICPAWSPR